MFEYANKKWDHKKINGVQVYHTEKVLDIKNNEPCWVIGLTYCEMQYKPNILDDVAIGAYGVPPPSKPSYSDPDSDLLMLEDESGRVQLDGDLIKNSIFVTGNVIGVLGIEIEAGLFKVLDVIYPGVSQQIERPLSSLPNNKIAIISGLEIDPDSFNPIRLELLKEFLLGELGNSQVGDFSKQISRLIIAGNSTKTLAMTHEKDGQKFYGTKTKSKYNSKAMSIIDTFINELLSSISVDILPGETDPAEAIFPQQPLHSAFFKKNKKYLVNNSDNPQNINFRSLTNPSWFEIDGTRFLGSGGQNINDMLKYTIPYYKFENSNQLLSSLSSAEGLEILEGDEKLKQIKLHADILEATIKWQNIIPSAPDTLWTYPFKDKDPFTLTETPHVYFAGNQPGFESRLIDLTTAEDNKKVQVRVLSVPKFSETGEILLLDVKTLEAQIVKVA